MKNYVNILFIITAGFWFSNSASQVLHSDSLMDITLSDGLKVSFAKKANSFESVEEAYYYLPVNLTFSTSKKGDPEFSFMAYKEGREISGGVLHFLVRWGLTSNQLKEADSLLKVVSGEEIVLMGGVMPEPSVPQGTISIEGSSKLATILKNSKATLGQVALLPNTKMASSFHLSRDDAKNFERLLNDNDELKQTLLVLAFELKFRKSNQSGVHITPYILTTNFKKLLNQ